LQALYPSSGALIITTHVSVFLAKAAAAQVVPGYGSEN